jgi:D-alanyl-D-alanine carboxypeptidase
LKLLLKHLRVGAVYYGIIGGKMMQRLRLVPVSSIIGVFALILLVQSAFALPSSIDAVDAYFRRRAAHDDFTGMVLMASGGKILYERSFGESDREHHIPLHASDPMRIGSLTKPITAVAALRAIEEGKMRLEDPLCKYLSSCPEGWATVTIDNLLTHSSGLPDLFEKLPAVPVEQTAHEIDKVLVGQDTKPLEPAGAGYRYNNFGYVLIGYVLEKVYSKGYPDIMAQEVFSPARMKYAIYDYPDRLISNRVHGYVRRDSILSNATGDPAAFSAGGLLLSSSDLFEFQYALFHDSLLKPQDLALLFMPPEGQNYGRGWQVAQIFGRKVYQHNGGTKGASASFVYVPGEDLWIHVMSNVEDTPTRADLCDALGRFYGVDYIDPTQAPTDLASEARFAGLYRFEDGSDRTILFRDGKLLLVSRGTEFVLRPLASGRYALAVDEQSRLDFQITQQSITLVRSRCGGEYAKATREGST